jgi:hypothetical protein
MSMLKTVIIKKFGSMDKYNKNDTERLLILLFLSGFVLGFILAIMMFGGR